MASIVGFLKKLGSVFKALWKGIEKVIPDEQLLAGIDYVEHAIISGLSKPEARHWVIAQLMNRFGIGENIARLITELAVYQVKRGVSHLADDVEGHITEPPPEPTQPPLNPTGSIGD